MTVNHLSLGKTKHQRRTFHPLGFPSCPCGEVVLRAPSEGWRLQPAPSPPAHFHLPCSLGGCTTQEGAVSIPVPV